MPARVAILCGPARCGKTERLLARYRHAMAEGPLGGSLWLAPTGRAAAEVRDHLLDGSLAGCFAPGVMTFAKFAEAVLRKAGVTIRPVTRSMQRELIRQILGRQIARGRLKYFGSIAKTSGLTDLVCEFIGELKRLEIWPEQFHNACAARGLSQKDIELSEIYDAYQQALQEHGLFDAEGRFWSARDVLRKDEGGRMKDESQAEVHPSSLILHPSFVIVDGFTDFTRTQHEILETLAGRADEMYVSLPLEAEPRRNDLFAKPLKTLGQLRRRHPDAVVEELDRPADPSWPAMRHLERTLFVDPSALGPPPSARDIEILAAASQLGEIEMIAGRIKRMLVEGLARPGEVAVVFRSVEPVVELIDEVFGRFGIPTAGELDRPLHRWPALRALVALLQLDLDDWPFDRLLGVLKSNYFQPTWPEWTGARLDHIERAIRRLQIPRGRERLIEQLDASDTKPRPSVAPGATLAVVQRLAAALDDLPNKATLPDWANAWDRLARDTGLLAAPDSAWNLAMKTLAETGTLAAWLRRRPPELDRREALDALLDILDGERLGSTDDEAGRVRILKAKSVRSLRVPYLFLAGLSEKAFPPPEREDRLYGEAESLRLIDAGLTDLLSRAERTREEMLLFYEAVTCATKQLYLSYPALDESAQPLLPSPLLAEVEQAFGPGRIPRTERNDLSPIPQDDEPLSESEFRVKAMATALDGNVALLAGLLARDEGFSSAIPSPLIAGLTTINHRQDRDQFGPFEGMLQGEKTLAALAGEFPPERVFSATDLERYASCPFRFLMERVLKVEPVEDLALEFDVLHRGRVVHDVLANFHHRVNERLGRPASPLELDPSEYDAMLGESIREAFLSEPAGPFQAALHEIDRRLVVEWLSQYRGQLEKYDAQWSDFQTPMAAEFSEVSFGRSGEAAPSTDRPIEFLVGGQVFRVSGRIDRIDTGQVAGETAFNVLDYKTGASIKFSPESIKAGTTLQLPLYVLATVELILSDRDAIPWRAGYWYVRDGGFKPRQALRMYRHDDQRIELEPTWEDIRDGLRDTVAGIIKGMRGGRFPVSSADEHCTGHCPFSTICRINQVRSLEKTCQPTANE